MTFRIEKDIMKYLRKESKIREISLNMLVGDIFKNFIDWYVFESSISMVPLHKTVVTEMFRSLKKDQVIDIAINAAKNEYYDTALFMKSKVTEQTFLDWFELRTKNSYMPVVKRINGRYLTYTIKHNICLNWSIFNKIILEMIFQEFISKEIDIQISDKSFTISLESYTNI